MSRKISTLSDSDEKKIREMLDVADKSLSTDRCILETGAYSTQLVGGAIGGKVGKELIAGGVLGISTVAAATGATAGFVGFGSAAGIGSAAAGATITGLAGITLGTVLLPMGIVVLIGGLIKFFADLGTDNSVREEERKQANYAKELSEKMNRVYEVYTTKTEQLKNMHEKDQEMIRKLQMKIAEYELVFEALKKEYDGLAKNLA